MRGGRGESIDPEKLPFVGKKVEKAHLFRTVTLQEPNIYSGPGIRRQRPIIGKEQRKGGQKQSKNGTT